MRKAALAAAAAAFLAPQIAQAQSVGGIVSGATGAAGTALGGVGGAVGGVGSAVGGVGGAVGGVGGAVGGLGGAIGGVGGAIGGVGGAIGGVGGAIGGVGGAVGGVGGAVGGIGGAVGGIGGGGAVGAGLGAASPGPVTTGSIGSATGLGAGRISTLGGVPSIRLPSALAPCEDGPRRRERARNPSCGPRYAAYFPAIGSVTGTREDLDRFRSPLRPRPGTPQEVVENCRTAIVASALPYGVVRVDAASAGPMQSSRGGFAAPVEFRIVYNREGGLETRQATISCRMNAAGRVVTAA